MYIHVLAAQLKIYLVGTSAGQAIRLVGTYVYHCAVHAVTPRPLALSAIDVVRGSLGRRVRAASYLA